MTTVSQAKPSSKIGLILLAFIAFISLGLPDGLLGVAWPSVRETFGVPLDSLGFFLFSGMIGYLSSSFVSGKVIARFGVGNVLAASCLLTGGALLGYSISSAYIMMVALGLFSGLGAGAIDAGLNTYIAANHGERLMQWLHASFGVGITLGPFIMSTAVNTFGQWRLGYMTVGIAQVALAVCFFLTAKMWVREPSESAEPVVLTDYKTRLRDTVRYPRAWLSAALFFVYTGVELGLGHWAYTLLTEGRGVDPLVAGGIAGSYWGMFTIGRIAGGVYAHRVNVHSLLLVSMVAALGGAVLVLINVSEAANLIGIGIVGLAIAPIFPGLMSGTTSRVGAKHAANTIGLQISAAGFGATAMPTLAGILAQRVSLEIIPLYLVGTLIVLLALYLFAYGRKPVEA